MRTFAHQNDLLYYETSAFWNRDDDDTVTGNPNRGGIGVLIDSMVEEIIDDVINERMSAMQYSYGQGDRQMSDANGLPR